MPIEIGGRTSLKELQVDQEIWDTCASELQLSASRHVRDYLRRLLEGQVLSLLTLLVQKYKYWRCVPHKKKKRRTQYDISVSSEIMAILALADSLAGTLTLVA